MKIYIVSLGCDKNRVDTESVLGYLDEGGHVVVNEADEADMFVINSCAFILSAVKESLAYIFELAKYSKPIILLGCLAMRYGESITGEGAEGLKEVSAFIGNEHYDRICDVIERVLRGERVVMPNTDDYTFHATKRISTTPLHYAYLKIAEGCNNKCLFCTIPSIRGRYVSNTPTNVLSEVDRLVSGGVKELLLVAQDVTRYGSDLQDGSSLVGLLREIVKRDVRWTRLLYCYPECVSDDLIEIVSNEERIASYMDIPLQHISDNVLKGMGRRSREADIRTLLDKALNRIAVRTTFMVGYPGETESDFLKLLDFIREYPFENVGFFSYSREEGTPSYSLSGQIPFKEKRSRLLAAERAFSAESLKRQKAKIGSLVRTSYDGIDYNKRMFYGHTEVDAPDIDKKLYFTANRPLEIGEVYTVRIEKSTRLDLKGVVTDEFTD